MQWLVLLTSTKSQLCQGIFIKTKECRFTKLFRIISCWTSNVTCIWIIVVATFKCFVCNFYNIWAISSYLPLTCVTLVIIIWPCPSEKSNIFKLRNDDEHLKEKKQSIWHCRFIASVTVGQESLLENVENCVGLKLSFLFLLRHAFKTKTLRLFKKIALLHGTWKWNSHPEDFYSGAVLNWQSPSLERKFQVFCNFTH